MLSDISKNAINRCRGAALDPVCCFSCFDRLLRALLQLLLLRLGAVEVSFNITARSQRAGSWRLE